MLKRKINIIVVLLFLFSVSLLSNESDHDKINMLNAYNLKIAFEVANYLSDNDFVQIDFKDSNSAQDKVDIIFANKNKSKVLLNKIIARKINYVESIGPTKGKETTLGTTVTIIINELEKKKERKEKRNYLILNYKINFLLYSAGLELYNITIPKKGEKIADTVKPEVPKPIVDTTIVEKNIIYDEFSNYLMLLFGFVIIVFIIFIYLLKDNKKKLYNKLDTIVIDNKKKLYDKLDTIVKYNKIELYQKLDMLQSKKKNDVIQPQITRNKKIPEIKKEEERKYTTKKTIYEMKYTRYIDQIEGGYGFLDDNLADKKKDTSTIVIKVINERISSFSITEDQNNHKYFTTNLYKMENGFEFENDYKNNKRIQLVSNGNLEKVKGGWKITKKSIIKFV